VSRIKTVPHLISYPHDFSHIFAVLTPFSSACRSLEPVAATAFELAGAAQGFLAFPPPKPQWAAVPDLTWGGETLKWVRLLFPTAPGAPPWSVLLPPPRKCLAKRTHAHGPLREAGLAKPWAARVLHKPDLWPSAWGRAGKAGTSRFRATGHCFIFLFSEYIQILGKFKNLCMIHLNSENCEINFVG
jgi:hypothetical protein